MRLNPKHAKPIISGSENELSSWRKNVQNFVTSARLALCVDNWYVFIYIYIRGCIHLCTYKRMDMNGMCVRKWKFFYVFLPIYASVYAHVYVQKVLAGTRGAFSCLHHHCKYVFCNSEQVACAAPQFPCGASAMCRLSCI